jgi:hypothetical protein
MTAPLLITLSCLLFLSGCKKKSLYPDNGLPAVTSVGNDVFACHRDGTPWISERGAPSMNGIYSNDTLYARGTVDKADRSESLEIILYDVNYPTQTTYAFNDTAIAYVEYISFGPNECFSNFGGFGQMVVRKITNGSVTITRADDQVLAGTFQFGLTTDLCDTIHFTNGRFDLRIDN